MRTTASWRRSIGSIWPGPITACAEWVASLDNSEPSGQPLRRPASDVNDPPVANLPATEHEQASRGTQICPYLPGAPRSSQPIWCLDITYIPFGQGLPLTWWSSLNWVSRVVPAWRLSNTLGTDFCVEALEKALVRYGRPEIFNADQGLPSRKRG